jgi:hypothetical protein
VPAGVEATQIDYDDQAGLTKALTGVDIVLYVYNTLFNLLVNACVPRSLLGGPAILTQKKIISPAKAAGVKLFAPSEYGVAWTKEDGACIPLIEDKHEVEDELVKSGLPYVKFNSGGFTEYFLEKPYVFFAPSPPP